MENGIGVQDDEPEDKTILECRIDNSGDDPDVSDNISGENISGSLRNLQHKHILRCKRSERSMKANFIKDVSSDDSDDSAISGYNISGSSRNLLCNCILHGKRNECGNYGSHEITTCNMKVNFIKVVSSEDSDDGEIFGDYIPGSSRNPLRKRILHSKRNERGNHGSSKITTRNIEDIIKDLEVNFIKDLKNNDSDDSDVSGDNISGSSRNLLRNLILHGKSNEHGSHGSSEITSCNTVDINKNMEVNSIKDVNSIACSSGTQLKYCDPDHISVLEQTEVDYGAAATGSVLNVPKLEFTVTSTSKGNLIEVAKTDVNESSNEMHLAMTDKNNLSSHNPEFDENVRRMSESLRLQTDLHNKQDLETASQLPVPSEHHKIESIGGASVDVSFSNADDQSSHIATSLSSLTMRTSERDSKNFDTKLPDSIKSEEKCNPTSQSSDIPSPVAVCDHNTNTSVFTGTSAFTKKMSFVSADDKTKVSFSFPSSTGPDLSFGLNKAFSNLPASKNSFHVKTTSSNTDGLFKFKISSLSDNCTSVRNDSSMNFLSKCKFSSLTSTPQDFLPAHSSTDSDGLFKFGIPSSSSCSRNHSSVDSLSKTTTSSLTSNAQVSVNSSSNSDGLFNFSIPSLSNSTTVKNALSMDSLSKSKSSTLISNAQHPLPVSNSKNVLSSFSFFSTSSPVPIGNVPFSTSSNMTFFQNVHPLSSKANNMSKCSETASLGMNTSFSPHSQNPISSFKSSDNGSSFVPNTGKFLSLFDKKTNLFSGFSCTTNSPSVNSSPVFHFTNPSSATKLGFPVSSFVTPKSSVSSFVSPNQLPKKESESLQESSFKLFATDSTNKNSGLMNSEPSGVDLFGVTKTLDSSFGSTEQQTTTKQFQPNSKTTWKLTSTGSGFEPQSMMTGFTFGVSSKILNDTFKFQCPEMKLKPNPRRRRINSACGESRVFSSKTQVPFRVTKDRDVCVKDGVTQTIEVHHQHITAMPEYRSLSFEELRYQHDNCNTEPYTVTCTTSNKNTQTTDTSSLDIEKYLNNMWKVLECPVCLEIVTPPVLQCEQGHHVCSSCWEKVPSCPLCKRYRTQTRNYVAEALVEKLPLPCKYRVDGCMKTMSHIKKTDHEDTCVYRTCFCLVDGCNQAYNFMAMAVHLKTSHIHLLSGIHFCVSKREQFSWTLLKPSLQNLVHAFDVPDWGLFLLRHKESVLNTYLWMEMLGFDVSEAATFCYSVEAGDTKEVRSVTYKGPVFPLHSVVNESQDCLIIAGKFLNALKSDFGFHLKISIWKS